MVNYNDRRNPGTMAILPVHYHNADYLGFGIDFAYPEGIPASNVRMHQIDNTRIVDDEIRDLIEKRWQIIKEQNPNMKSFPRERYEGCNFDLDTKSLQIFWSLDDYKTHAVMRNTKFPKPYQANLFTINGIPLTEDGRIPIVVRNPKTTDQGRIRHTAPAGFCDVYEVEKMLKGEDENEATVRKLFNKLGYSLYSPEMPHTASKRELNEELRYVTGSFPPEIFNPDDMMVLGIVYNSLKNFDYTTSVLIPLRTNSDNVKLKGSEHEEINWIPAEYKDLSDTLLDLSMTPEDNSGHLRGDITLTIAHLHGPEAAKEALSEVVKAVAKYHLQA